MIPNFNELIEQAKCAGNEAARRACNYADRIVERLDVLIEAVQEEEFEENRRRFRNNVTAASLTVNNVLATVPAGTEWELENISIAGSNGQVGGFYLIVDGLEIASFNANWFSNTGVNGLVVEAGSEIAIRATSTAAEIRYYIQFKERRRKKGRRGPATQAFGPVYNAGVGGTPPPDSQRHAA